MKQYYDDYDYDDGPTLDDEAKSHGYADYSDYREEYYQGHTSGELGEPSYHDPSLDEKEPDSEDYYEVKTDNDDDIDDYDIGGPTLDDEAKSHGYADYSDYCEEYWEGHTGGELGDPF